VDCNAADVTTAAGGGTSDKETYDFDLFALGGGTAGVRAARLSASMGKTPNLQPTVLHLDTLRPLAKSALGDFSPIRFGLDA